MNRPKLTQISQRPSIFLFSLIFSDPFIQLVPLSNDEHLSLALNHLQKRYQLILDIVLFCSCVYNDQSFESIRISCRNLCQTTIEELSMRRWYFSVFKIYNKVPLLDDPADEHVFFQRLQQICGGRVVILGRVSF